ncbi:homeobox protein prospero-like isoform X2 [Penaeus indicus]|uniref:homeobox protein prospero-like isoform X2 n=1 Tax=Penaeus indicus TaxID=29960 RepID=UPI00300CA5A9
MAHEEESDCFGEKLLKKPKRIRTRVDAGEPRNAYSAFSSLPNLCGVSVNAVRPGSAPNLFSASQSFCGLPFVNYFNPPPTVGSRGMLSELFGAHTKPVAPIPPEDTVSTMGVLDKVTSSSVHSADAVNSVIRGPEADNVLLREILQGRKRDLLTMEELEAARSLHNNNNSYKGATDTVEASTDETTTPTGRAESVTAEDGRCESEAEEALSQANSPRADSPEPRKRLENIVSVIHSSPTPNATPVNGCKKRKLYLPQQHETRPSYDSQTEEGEGAAEPDNKTRRLEEEEEQSEGRVAEAGEEGGLQIDLSVRRRTPDPQRPPSPKPPTSTSSDSNDASSYLLDYAQRLIRNQEARLQRENDLKNTTDLSEKLQLLRNISMGSQVTDLEGLADVLKTEITASLAVIIDTIVNKYVQQRKLLTKQAEVAAEQLNRDIASQLMERSRSPRSQKMPDRMPPQMPRVNGIPNPHGPLNLSPYPGGENALNLNHLRPPLYKPPHGFFHGNMPPMGGMIPTGQTSPYGGLEPEQDEALPLVVTPKKKRHKVTDSRLTPRTVGRLLEDFPRYGPLPSMGGGGPNSPRSSPPPPPLHHPHQRPTSFPQPPPLLPVSLPTSVAIPNPSLHDTGLLYPNYYGHRSSPPMDRREESPAGPPPPHPHPLLHPALLAATSPDSFSRFLHGGDHDRASDCSPADTHYDGVQPTISFYAAEHRIQNHSANLNMIQPSTLTDGWNSTHSSTLTPMHLRKAKLMFFFVRYPSSSVLKTYFPDIKFNKNNTAQLVKWFSNFREFYYIQMEKYARQAISEGTKSADEVVVNMDAEIIRALNLHYNRNNHLEIPEHFRYVVEQTLREFFKAIQEQKDQEQSWKKAIYKVIARLDEPVPEYFKSPTFLEQLE